METVISYSGEYSGFTAKFLDGGCGMIVARDRRVRNWPNHVT
jgi:hypothetical protein